MSVLTGAKQLDSNSGVFSLFGGTAPTNQNTMPDGVTTIPEGSLYTHIPAVGDKVLYILSGGLWVAITTGGTPIIPASIQPWSHTSVDYPYKKDFFVSYLSKIYISLVNANSATPNPADPSGAVSNWAIQSFEQYIAATNKNILDTESFFYSGTTTPYTFQKGDYVTCSAIINADTYYPPSFTIVPHRATVIYLISGSLVIPSDITQRFVALVDAAEAGTITYVSGWQIYPTGNAALTWTLNNTHKCFVKGMVVYDASGIYECIKGFYTDSGSNNVTYLPPITNTSYFTLISAIPVIPSPIGQNGKVLSSDNTNYVLVQLAGAGIGLSGSNTLDVQVDSNAGAFNTNKDPDQSNDTQSLEISTSGNYNNRIRLKNNGTAFIKLRQIAGKAVSYTYMSIFGNILGNNLSSTANITTLATYKRTVSWSDLSGANQTILNALAVGDVASTSSNSAIIGMRTITSTSVGSGRKCFECVLADTWIRIC